MGGISIAHGHRPCPLYLFLRPLELVRARLVFLDLPWLVVLGLENFCTLDRLVRLGRCLMAIGSSVYMTTLHHHLSLVKARPRFLKL